METWVCDSCEVTEIAPKHSLGDTGSCCCGGTRKSYLVDFNFDLSKDLEWWHGNSCVSYDKDLNMLFVSRSDDGVIYLDIQKKKPSMNQVKAALFWLIRDPKSVCLIPVM